MSHTLWNLSFKVHPRAQGLSTPPPSPLTKFLCVFLSYTILSARLWAKPFSLKQSRAYYWFTFSLFFHPSSTSIFTYIFFSPPCFCFFFLTCSYQFKVSSLATLFAPSLAMHKSFIQSFLFLQIVFITSVSLIINFALIVDFYFCFNTNVSLSYNNSQSILYPPPPPFFLSSQNLQKIILAALLWLNNFLLFIPPPLPLSSKAFLFMFLLIYFINILTQNKHIVWKTHAPCTHNPAFT